MKKLSEQQSITAMQVISATIKKLDEKHPNTNDILTLTELIKDIAQIIYNESTQRS